MLVGPVFNRELATAPRSWRLYLSRAIYVGALFGLVCTAWLILFGSQPLRTLGDLARFGAAVFALLAPVQLAMAIGFSALLTAAAVAQEKDRRTLDLLLMTRMDLMEAAEIDGASSWYRIFKIQLPMISPTLFFTGITTILIIMDELVGVVDVLTEGGPYGSSTNLVYFLYERAFRQFQFGEASAVSIIIMVLVALATWMQFKVLEKYVHYQ